MPIIIVGEDSFIVTSDKKSTSLFPIESLKQNIPSENCRVIFNNGDFLIQHESVPHISPLLQKRVLKNYTNAKKAILKLAGAHVAKTATPVADDLVTLSVIKNTPTYGFLFDNNNLPIAENFAFILPIVLKLKNKSWLVVSENRTGNTTISVGYNKSVFLHRSFKNVQNLQEEVEKSIKYASRFDLKEQNIEKIAFLKFTEFGKELINFSVYNEYGDVYVSRKLSTNHISKPFVIVNNKEYIKMKISNIFRKILICALPVLFVLVVIYIQQNYEISSKNEVKTVENNALSDSITEFNRKINSMLEKSLKSLKSSVKKDDTSFRIIDRDYIKKSYERLDKELKDLEEVINKNKEIVFGKPRPMDDMSHFELILPRGINLIHYNYSFHEVNGDKVAEVELVVSVEQSSSITQLVSNLKQHAKDFKISSIKEIAPNRYRISLHK